MAFLDGVRNFLTTGDLEERALDSFVDHPGLTEQMLAIQGLTAQPWRPASIREALGVPAILRAVSLISNTTGSLAMRGYRNGAVMPEAPRLVQRPDPFSTPRTFYRDTAYYLASRGEFVWWIAARDSDGVAVSLIVVPLAELQIEDNPNDRRFPIYTWGKLKSFRFSPAAPGGDFVHETFLKEPGTLRGVGPLQLCGAAVSVTVEAQQWAANFFAGDTSSVELKSLVDINEEEANALLDAWMAKQRAGLPRITNPTLDWKDHTIDPKSAQMTEARNHQDGEAARMFGIPGSLLEYSAPGSSLTYQNVEQEYTKFLRTCLAPNYLEPIEQAMTDLLSRSTVARFNVDGLLRADIKTRYAVYESGIKAGILDAPEARRMEGLDPGDIEVAPVPWSPPQAVPSSLPELRSESLQLQTTQREPAMMFAEAMMALATREQPSPVVNVHPAPVTFERGAVQVDAPDLSGLAEAFGDLAKQPPPSVNVDVAAPDMSGVAEALSEMATRPMPTPEVTVNTPEVHVEPPHVTFEAGSINTPEVNVQPANVSVNVPEQLAPQVTVNVPRQRSTRKKVTRDDANNITEIIEEPI